MNIRKLKIVDLDTNYDLAYLYPGEASWRDPFGGDFAADEQRMFFSVAEDGCKSVMLHAGTKHERNVRVSFAVEFG